MIKGSSKQNHSWAGLAVHNCLNVIRVITSFIRVWIIAGKKLFLTNVQQYLGVIINENLTWGDHVNYI